MLNNLGKIKILSIVTTIIDGIISIISIGYLIKLVRQYNTLYGWADRAVYILLVALSIFLILVMILPTLHGCISLFRSRNASMLQVNRFYKIDAVFKLTFNGIAVVGFLLWWLIVDATPLILPVMQTKMTVIEF